MPPTKVIILAITTGHHVLVKAACCVHTQSDYIMSENHSNTYSSAFFIVPSYILDLDGMTLGYLRVYETIFQFWNHNKTCFLSEKSLCIRTNLKRSQVYAALSFFEQHNELKRVLKNSKRYIVRPEKIIETDCSFIDPDPIQNNTRSNTIQTSGLADVDVRSSGRETSGAADYNIKKINKENNNITPISPKQKKTDNSFPLNEMLVDNPHNLPEELIVEWQSNRKKKITKRVWEKTNSVLLQLNTEGIKAIEAFEIMLEKQWSGIEVRYFKEEINYRNGSNTSYKPGDAFSRAMASINTGGNTYEHKSNVSEGLR